MATIAVCIGDSERRTVPLMDPMRRLDADMRRKGQEPFDPEPHAVFSPNPGRRNET